MKNQEQSSAEVSPKFKFYSHPSFSEGGWNTMKPLCTIMIASAFLFSCNFSDKDGNTSSNDVEKEMNDVIEVSKDYSAEKWNDLINNIEELENDIESSTNEVVQNYYNLSADFRDEFENQKQKIAEEKAELDRKIEQFQKASGEKKEELKVEIIQLKTAFDKSISTFEKEMANRRN